MELLRQEDPETWEIIRETVVQNRSSAEVAEESGRSPEAVRKRKSRGLKRLRELITQLRKLTGDDMGHAPTL